MALAFHRQHVKELVAELDVPDEKKCALNVPISVCNTVPTTQTLPCRRTSPSYCCNDHRSRTINSKLARFSDHPLIRAVESLSNGRSISKSARISNAMDRRRVSWDAIRCASGSRNRMPRSQLERAMTVE
ncbi:hypothetical protein MVEN_01139800 [Mycena venus]|uniref:Uncharacterized protein n=1 Tax=Mycena venus TaxID=2733690 RepID=A0A8H7CXT2_9AGAR|nr:hypothetical protein MVEN_01139800 [Mycena venus]